MSCPLLSQMRYILRCAVCDAQVRSSGQLWLQARTHEHHDLLRKIRDPERHTCFVHLRSLAFCETLHPRILNLLYCRCVVRFVLLVVLSLDACRHIPVRDRSPHLRKSQTITDLVVQYFARRVGFNALGLLMELS